MSQAETIQPTSDERVMAALSHFFGLIAALIIWATQKDKSRFLRFQSLQAMAFDAVLMIVFLVMTVCLMGVTFIGVLAAVYSAAQFTGSPDSFFPLGLGSMLLPLAMYFFIMPVSLAALLVRTIAAVSVASGHDFRYPLIAGRVEAFLAAPGASGQQGMDRTAG